MAEEETKEAWRANDVLREHMEEIREETKSKFDGLMEEIDLLKWMMAQTFAANNKTKSIEKEHEGPEGSVGESYAIEDHNELDDEEERVQQEMRKAKEHFEKKQAEQGKEVILYNIYRDHTTLVAKATILSIDRKKMVGGRELGGECCKVVINYIIKRDALLPRPIGNVTTMRQAQGRSIAWLYKHMEEQKKSTDNRTSAPNEGRYASVAADREQVTRNADYSLRSILLVAEIDVSNTKTCLDTSISMTNNMDRRE